MGYASRASQQLPWEDRFREPSLDDLRSHYPKQMANLLEAAREQLASFEELSEEIAWQGLPWRWTILFSASRDDDHAWAYLIPDPEAPRLAMPMTADQIETLPMRRLKKHVRDGLEKARTVAGIWWATWSFSNKRELEDVMDIVRRRYKYMAT